MLTNKDEFVARYCVVKHSWRGKYTRIFCIGRRCVATIDPKSIFAVTNIFDYNLVVDVVPSPKAPTDIDLIIRKGGGTDTMHFSCMTAAERAELLTDVQRFRCLFDPAWKSQLDRQVFAARKYQSHEEWKPVVLQVSNIGLLQKTVGSGDFVGVYNFAHINGFGTIAGDTESLVVRYGHHKKLHRYQVQGGSEGLLRLLCEMAAKFLGLQGFENLKPMQPHEFDMGRLGVCRTELATLAEFAVMKISPKHDNAPVRRVLSTTSHHIVERDPATYNAISVYRLDDVFSVVRSEIDAQKFEIEYKRPHVVKTYTSSTRDALLGHIVDACRAINHSNVSIRIITTDRGKRAAPLQSVVSEEIEGTLLRCLVEPAKGGGPVSLQFNEVVEYFNANVEYSGLRSTENKDGIFAENREKLIFSALSALLNNFPRTQDPAILVQQFYALRRICVSRTGFASVAVVQNIVDAIGAAAVSALKLHNMAVSHAVVDFLVTLMTPMHHHYEPYHEQVNKHRMLTSEAFLKHLLQLLRSHIEQESGALVIQSLLDFFSYALVPPYSETTDAEIFSHILSMFVDMLGRHMFTLFAHPCRAIRLTAGHIVRVALEEGQEDQFVTVQRAALTEGGFLRAFHMAVFTEKDRELRDLARSIISLVSYDHQTAQDLMRRMMPVTLLHFLQSSDAPPTDEVEQERKADFVQATQNFRESKQGFFKKQFNPAVAAGTMPDSGSLDQPVVVFRQRVVQVQPRLNWPLFFFMLKKDHARPDLIWTHATRTELREAVEQETQAFQLGLEMKTEQSVCWNYQEFEVPYPSLASELKVGQHFPRLLFESAHPEVARPKEFFNDMYHRFLLVQDFKQRCQCLHGMAILYEHYAEEIGQFNDIEYMVQMLDAATSSIFRDRMLVFLTNLLRARLNVKPFIDCNGMKPLVELLTVAHLHIDRPQLQTNTMAIEANGSPVDLQDQEKEWHWVNEAGEKQEPVSYTGLRMLYDEGTVKPTTKVWAQGQGGWREFKVVPQLKWGVLCAGQPSVMTLTEVSCTVLDALMLLCAYYPTRDIDGSIMQPLPRVKRFLSDPSVLPHIVQLLLTFDPAVCTRVNRLMYLLMEDNPLMPRLFLSGYFFFSLMYTSSDVVPLCRMLQLSHRKQSVRFESDNEIIRSSALSVMLPPAMVCVLANHGAQKFAEIFLGEFETPEAIWGKDMRRYLIEKLAAHVSDFTPRLIGNVRATYSYCPVVGIEYEQLKNELFCSMYYLRHLCDAVKYPTWPVKDPVALMRDTLAAWKLELEKEPTTMSRESCLSTLEITDTTEPTSSQIRKAYFKLAAVYHPDKNPNGREQFEAIQKAYEFLASNTEISDAPDSNKIALLLRTQSILFDRFSEKMKEYKYAGYSLLLRLIAMEFADDAMLNKEVVLMDPAVELCFHTVNNNALNADELLAEGGIELVSNVMNRCFELVTPNSTDADVQARIVANSIRTFGVAGKFEDCLIRMLTIPSIAVHASRGIAFLKSPKLSRAAVVATQAFCKHAELQQIATDSGAVWHLLQYIFRFDYTLEEAGIEVSEENHTQLFNNLAAKAAFQCLCALAGYHPGPEDLLTGFNPVIDKLLESLLTPFVVKMMREEPNKEGTVLRYLNSNHETPYFLWNNTSRGELRDYLEGNSDQARDNAGGFGEMPSINTSSFEYTAHSSELIVGGVFVRIYNMQPQYPIADPPGFLSALLNHAQYLMPRADPLESPVAVLSASMDDTKRNAWIMMEANALVNLLTAYPQAAPIAASAMPALFSLLDAPEADAVARVFDVMAKCCAAIECITAMGSTETALSQFVLALNRCGAVAHGPALSLIQMLFGDRNAVLQCLHRGFYIVLLDIFCTTRNVEVKEAACSALAKAFVDKLSGPMVLRRAAKMIPLLFLETMKENPIQAGQMFETQQENPELVWNANLRGRVMDDIARARAHIVETLEGDIEAHWKIPEDMVRPESADEMQVGGVYLSLYVKQPNWAVRQPKQFLQALLEKFDEVADRGTAAAPIDTEALQLVATSIVSLLSSGGTADFIVGFGYIPKLVRNLSNAAEQVARAALRIMHEVANSRPCVESMANVDPVLPLFEASKRFDEDFGVAMDTLERLMARSHPDRANMLKCAITCDLVNKLLGLLESGLTHLGATASSGRAIVIKVLKTMMASSDPIYGLQVQHILNESAIWWRFKDQNHDLFLTSAAFGGFITGPKQGPVLSLTAGPGATAAHRMDDTAPPPMSP